MDAIYNGFKVVYSNGQFPGFFGTWDKANAAAATYFNNSCKSVEIYGFIGETKRHIKTYRKTPRT